MPIGSSDGDTFEDQWAHAMSSLESENTIQDTGKGDRLDTYGIGVELLRKEYLNSVIDPLFPGDLPVERPKYDDSPTPRAAGRERNLTKHLQDLELDMTLRQHMMGDSYDTEGSASWNKPPKPENIGEVIPYSEFKDRRIDKLVDTELRGEGLSNKMDKQETRSAISRALGGSGNVIPLNPYKQGVGPNAAPGGQGPKNTPFTQAVPTEYRDMTDEEFADRFTESYSRRTQDAGRMYEPKDAEGIREHIEALGEGFFREDQKGMDDFLKKNTGEYQIFRTPQEGNGKRGYYIRLRLTS